MATNQTTIRGTARNVQWREKGNYTVLTFNIEQIDQGNVVGNTSVELRETMIKGTLVDGDEVEATGEIDPEGILIPKKIHNLRTGIWITPPRGSKWVIAWLFPFIFAVIGGIIGLFFFAGLGLIFGFVIGFIVGGFVLNFTAVFYAVINSVKSKT